ncbi:phytase [Pseudomonas turukhanskensis]|uniref:3-phytase n=1 Tax=Pseudomonas turukhanskensis TaxID=1806536 RepID=A0A9W6NEI9_9PSED|nr:phytase [Pseudomonas turukhanskensis]GLK88033.1 3-phytase [Pseudomonas turukhanskensis]
MNPLFTRTLLAASLLLAGCDVLPNASEAKPVVSLSPWSASAKVKAEDVRFLPADAANSTDLRVAASERNGLLLTSADGAELARVPGNYSGLDSRTLGKQVLVASIDGATQQAALVLLDPQTRQWATPLLLPARDYPMSGLCLYRDEAANLHLFLLGEDGKGEQWLVGSGTSLNKEPLRLRGVPTPPGAEYCHADDAANRLYVNEEGVGLWAFSAAPEADTARAPVDLRAPFGTLAGSPQAMVSVPGGLVALDSEDATLHLYQQDGEQWKNVASLALDGLQEPERLDARVTANGLDLLIEDGEQKRIYQGQLNWKPTPQLLPPPLPNVPALRQTEPVGRQGDAADDPAIWLHPTQPHLSRVLGTNKKQGLLAYDLDGRLLQELPVGRLNNVDVRAGFTLAGKPIDLAVASNRDNNSISLFAIDRASGELREAGEVRTPLAQIYGICLFQPAPGELYAFANGKDGTFVQYRLTDEQGQIQGKQVRRFNVNSQPEGCVADDQQQRLFIGEEDVGVWAVDARPDASGELTSVLKVGDVLKADVEGMGLYHGPRGNYLVVSSQGNDSYVLLDAQPPFAVQGAFRVGLNGALGIDGASETDGLEVTGANLGGAWSQGLLVVQDGRKRMPESTQNFKLVPWRDVARTLGLP